jgi:hypothetical protein
MSRQFQRLTRSQALGNAAGQGVNPVPSMPEQFIEDWWIENVTVAALAQNAVANANIQVQADSAFKLIKLGLVADIAGAAITEATRPVPLVTMQLTDTGSGRNLFSAAVALGALFGNGPLPHILPVPRLFLPRSNIQLQFTNYSGGAGTTYNFRLALEGTKVFKLGGSW